MVDFEVLDLQFAVSLLLGVDQLRGYIELQMRVIIVFSGRCHRVQSVKMRYAFGQVLLKTRLLHGSGPLFGLVGQLSCPFDWLLVVLQARMAQVHGRGGRSDHLFVASKNVLNADFLQLAGLAGDA